MTTQWILLRGLIREQRHWEGFPDLLRQRHPDISIITVDIAGNGSRYQEKSPLSINGLMESVRSQLQDQNLKPPYNLIAISLGAMIGLEWLSEHPEELEQAVLMNTSLRAFNPFYERLQPQNFPSVLASFLKKGRYHREKAILDITANIYQDKETLAHKWAAYSKDHPISTRNALRQITAAARYKAPRIAPHKRILVLCGAKDRLVSPKCSEYLAKHWQLPYKEHPTAGHDLTLDAGHWVAEQIGGFFTPEPAAQHQ